MPVFNPNATIFKVPHTDIPYNKGTVFDAIARVSHTLTQGNYPVIQATDGNTTFYYTIKSNGADPNPIILPSQLSVTQLSNETFSQISYNPDIVDPVPAYVLMASPLDFEESTLSNRRLILLKMTAGSMSFMANNGFFSQSLIDGVQSKVYMCYQDQSTFMSELLGLNMKFGLSIPNTLKSTMMSQTNNLFVPKISRYY